LSTSETTEQPSRLARLTPVAGSYALHGPSPFHKAAKWSSGIAMKYYRHAGSKLKAGPSRLAGEANWVVRPGPLLPKKRRFLASPIPMLEMPRSFSFGEGQIIPLSEDFCKCLYGHCLYGHPITGRPGPGQAPALRLIRSSLSFGALVCFSRTLGQAILIL